MTDHLTHGDYRRAAAITLHHRRGDTDGVLAIVNETNGTGRASQLLLAVLNLHGSFFKILRNDESMTLAADYVTGMGALEDLPDTGVCSAARLLDAHGRNDLDAINAELAGGDQRATLIFVALLDLYEVTLPELSGTLGMQWIQRHVEVMAAGEINGEEDQR